VGASLSLEGHKLAHWEQGHFVNLEVLDLSGEGIVLTCSPAKPKLAGEPITVTLENRLPYTVTGGALQLGGLHPVPRIESGKTVSFVLGSKVDGALDSFRSEWGPKLAEIEALQGDGFGWRGNLLLAAALERQDVDFRLDRRFTLRDKLDVYLLYASP
jgi:hypothetical protein